MRIYTGQRAVEKGRGWPVQLGARRGAVRSRCQGHPGSAAGEPIAAAVAAVQRERRGWPVGSAQREVLYRHSRCVRMEFPWV